jgi:hypothetical protein
MKSVSIITILFVFLCLLASPALAVPWVRCNDSEVTDVTHYEMELGGTIYDGGPYPMNWDVGWLEPGTYTMRAKACNAVACSGWSEEWIFTINPPIPPPTEPAGMYLQY